VVEKGAATTTTEMQIFIFKNAKKQLQNGQKLPKNYRKPTKFDLFCQISTAN
jgi:hypothetical protein